MRRSIEIQGLNIEIHEGGSGYPLLFLHDHDGVEDADPFLRNLSRHFRVIAPSHPGFGASTLPEWMDRLEDFPYIYLDLIDHLGIDAITLVGASIGGWIAADLATLGGSYFSHLILIAPVGIKTSGRDELTLPDLFAKTFDDVRKLTYADPQRARLDIAKLTDAELTIIARNRETLALTTWDPYMHDPKLKHRLHRVRVPTLLLRGDKDEFVSARYVNSFAALIPDAELITIPDGAHFVHRDQPDCVGVEIRRFTSPVTSAVAM